ncbi:hypothetical protein [Posidoniimonas corsicana]|nr:hypothetical protein [Posidoniimonas corsicana]
MLEDLHARLEALSRRLEQGGRLASAAIAEVEAVLEDKADQSSELRAAG